MSEQAGQEGPTPDFIPGWFAPREGNADPATREAVRIPEQEDFFPITFLRSTEMVRPAQRPQRGFTIGKVSEPGHDLFDLAVPPGYWIVRDADGALHNWRDEDFKAKYSRSDRDWRPPVERDVPSGRPAAAGRHRHGAEIPPTTMRHARHFFTEAEVADVWKGTPPAEGTRRHLILETIRGFADDLAAVVDLAGADTLLELADRVEMALALLQSTIDDEARERLVPTEGIESLSPEVQGAPRRRVLFATLDRMYQDKTFWPLTPVKCADALERALKDFDGMVEDEVERLDNTASDVPDREAELLEQREEARTREGRFAEERDCAFALLRWLLPVTVAKRID